MADPSAGNLANRIRSIPPVTRFFTISTVAVCFAVATDIVLPMQFSSNLPLLWDQWLQFQSVYARGGVVGSIVAALRLLFQLHRFVTCFLVPAGMLLASKFSAILDIYFFYTFANHLELFHGKFRGNFADCLWFTILTGTIILLLTYVYNVLVEPLHFALHHQMMLLCVTYIWLRGLKNSTINFMGIVPIKAYYLPLFNLFIKLVTESYAAFVDSVIGIVGGYLYQCIQSGTMPGYNLMPWAYAGTAASASRGSGSGSSGAGRGGGGRRIGIEASSRAEPVHTLNPAATDWIGDSVFDRGYLKAPAWLYKVLNLPLGNTVRTTAFTGKTVGGRPAEEEKATSSGFAWFGQERNPFQGKGHRLTD